MQVILLAAGQSSRLAPISDKNLLEFSGKTLIEHQVSSIKQAKIRDIVVVGNMNNAGILQKTLKSYKNVAVVEQKNLKDGMAGGVLAGAPKVSHKNILVMSSNDVFEADLFKKVIQASKGDHAGVIVGSKIEGYFPGGYLKFDKKDWLTDIVEKPKEGKEPSKYVNLVVHVYNDFSKFVDVLKKAKSKKDDVYEVALDTYIKKGKAKMQVLKYHDYWQPIKYPWHVLRVMEYFLEHQKPFVDKSAKISKTATITGNVVIGSKVKVMDHATIKGPVYIGEGSVIANHALVRESMVGSNCVIGFSTEIARSYLNHNVWSHTNYVGDSVVDSNVSFGAGTVIGNLRFDEKNVMVNIKGKKIDTGTQKFGSVIGHGVRFGINAATNPGVKVGANSFVGGNVMVDNDIDDNKVVILKQQFKVVSNKQVVATAKRRK